MMTPTTENCVEAGVLQCKRLTIHHPRFDIGQIPGGDACNWHNASMSVAVQPFNGLLPPPLT
jgi:hypothetical protein